MFILRSAYKIDNLRYTVISQRNSVNSFLLIYIFFFPVFLFMISLKTLIQKETSRLWYILYIVCFNFLLWNVLHSVGNAYWQDVSYRAIFIAIFNKLYLLYLNNPWFPRTLHKEYQKHRTFNIVTPNVTPNQIKQM